MSKACSRTAPQTGSRRTAGVIGHLDRERIRLGVDFRSRFIATRSENILAEFRWGRPALDSEPKRMINAGSGICIR